MTLRMREDDLQAAVLDLARRLGYLAYHTFNSTRSAPGFPDLVMVHPTTGALIVAELKGSRGRVTGPQQRWLDAFGIGHDAYLWRPEDWPDRIAPILLAGAGRQAT